ncbi:hypothetical protein [Muricoccus vinaceus]|uniref:Uncharacterized protein n=1 Tax=Muricoccus vinaceus TaxID=424704 RepID=A0ABV6IYU3_9PROT
MSTFRALSLPGRVVLVHDMPDQIVVSEFDAAEASTLLRQIEDALSKVLRGLSEQAGGPLCPETVG